MNAAHGFQTHVCEVRVSFLRLRWIPNCVYRCLFCENEAVWLLRNTQSHSLLVSGNLSSCFWRFCYGRHIKVDLSHQPSSNKWIVFFFTFPLLSQIFRPSKHPIVSWVHPWKQYLACFNEWMLTRSDPHFFSTLFFLLLQINHRTVQRLTAANPRLMQPPSLNVKHNEKKKTSPERLTYFIWILFGFKALIDCAMFRTIWPW